MTWEEFIVGVCAQFRDDLGSKVAEEFNKLQQISTLDDYLAKFEELKALISVRTPQHARSLFFGMLRRRPETYNKTLSAGIQTPRPGISYETSQVSRRACPSLEITP